MSAPVENLVSAFTRSAAAKDGSPSAQCMKITNQV